MDLENWTYPYRLRTSWALFLMLASAALMYVGYDNTFHDERGLVIDHFIHLGPAGARIFWACLGLIGVGLLLVTF